jgi:hypothetical protein
MQGIVIFTIYQIRVISESIHGDYDIFVSNLTIEVNTDDIVNVLYMCTICCVSGGTRPHLRLSARVRCWAADVRAKPHSAPVQRKLRRGTSVGRRTQSHQLYQLCKTIYLVNSVC